MFRALLIGMGFCFLLSYLPVFGHAEENAIQMQIVAFLDANQTRVGPGLQVKIIHQADGSDIVSLGYGIRVTRNDGAEASPHTKMAVQSVHVR